MLLHNYAVTVLSFCFSAYCEQMERMERETNSLRKAGVHTYMYNVYTVHVHLHVHVHVQTVVWVRIPPGAAHFFFEKERK